MQETEWTGCYDRGWQGVLTPESFAHPAKFSRGLIERIVSHMLAKGWLSKGDTVGDPFGGIGTGGIVCADCGIRWFGVELEPKFVELAEANFAQHRALWDRFNDPQPRIVQGDSREFARIVGELDAVVTSPPWESTEPIQDKSFRLSDGRKAPPQGQAGYGQSDGQIGNTTGATYWEAMRAVYEQVRIALKPGGVAAIVVKAYVKAGKIVPLPDDTLRLLEHLGFVPLERVRAMLVRETVEAGLFGEHRRRKERKSFFRRLAESKGSPRIDWEEVLFIQG